MKRNRQAAHAGVEETKANDARHCAAGKRIELGAGGHVGRQHVGIDLEVEHRQVTPTGREKHTWLLRHHRSSLTDWVRPIHCDS